MKKFSILALTLMLAFTFAACGNKEQVKDDAAAKTVETAKKAEPVKADPKVTCKADADKTAEACVTKAGKDKKAAAKCDAAKKAAYADCDKKK